MARFPTYKRRAAERQVKAALRPILHRQAARVAMHLRGHPQPLTAAATPDGWWDNGVEEEEVTDTLRPILGHAVDAVGYSIAAKLGASYVRTASTQDRIAAQARATAQRLTTSSRDAMSRLIDGAGDEEDAATAVEKWGNKASLARTTAVLSVAWAAIEGTMTAGKQAQDQTERPVNKTWFLSADHIHEDECDEADMESVPLDESFSNGYDSPEDSHPGCLCSMSVDWADEVAGDDSAPDDLTAAGSPASVVAASSLVSSQAARTDMPRRWRSNPAVLVEGVETTEMMPRLIDPGATTWRQLPRDLRAVFEDTGYGHENARLIGRIDTMARNGNFIVAEGVFADDDEDADKAVNLIGQSMLQHVSIDASGGVCIYEMIDPNGQVVPEEIAVELMWDEDFDSEGYYVRERWTEFEVGALTCVSMPAFADVGIALMGADASMPTAPVEAVVAAAGTQDVETSPVSTEPAGSEPTSPADEPGGEGPASPASAFPRLAALLATQRGDSLQASAAMRSLSPGAVLRASVAWDGGPPPEFFTKLALPGPTPFTITDDGEVYGHIAPDNECHVGWAAAGKCITVPRSASAYALFHASGEVRCSDGSRPPVGVVTMDTLHAPDGSPGPPLPAAAVLRHHMENTDAIVAYVSAFDDEWGVQVHGALREGLSIDRVRRAMASKPSGHWQHDELLAILMVPVPGFPVVRMEDGQQVSLVASLSPPHAIELPLRAALSGYFARRAVLAPTMATSLTPVAAPCSCQTSARAPVTACACGGHDLSATGTVPDTQAVPVADHPELVATAVPPSQEVTAFAALARRAELDALDRMMA